MNWILDYLTPVLAIAATAIGALVALDQITATSRIRRQSAFWRDEMSNPHLAYDLSAAQSLHRESIARLISLQAIPGKHLLFPAFAILVGLGGLVQAGIQIGRIPTDEMNWSAVMNAIVDPIALLGAFPIVLTGIIGWLRVLTERRRIEDAYLDGEKLHIESVNPVGENRRLEYTLGCGGVLLLNLFTFGICCLTFLFAVAHGMREHQVAVMPNWLIILMLVGVAGLVGGLFGPFMKLYEANRRVWKHPRPLTPTAGKAARTAVAGTPASIKGLRRSQW